jgi:hypothetical protein
LNGSNRLISHFLPQHAVHKLVPSFLGTKDVARLSWPTPNRQQAFLFNEGRPSTEGPNKDKPCIDWFFKGETRWTKGIAEIFANYFTNLYQKGKFPLIRTKPSNERIVEVFVGYIRYLKRGYIQESNNPQDAELQKQKNDKRSRCQGRQEQVKPSIMLELSGNADVSPQVVGSAPCNA